MRRWFWLVCGLLWGGPLFAAEPGLGVVRLVRAADAGEAALTLTLADADVVRLVAVDRNHDGRIDQAEVTAGEPALLALGAAWVSVSSDGGSLPLRPLGVTKGSAGGDCVWRFSLPGRADRGWELAFPRLAELTADYRQLVEVVSADGRVETERLLSAADSVGRVAGALSEPAQARAEERGPPPMGFGAFLKLGVEHIWTGYDHLLFLAGLLLVCHRRRDVVVVITSFTVAHSLTLGAAALGLVNAPARLVEPLIAASIVFVGVENILRRGEPKARWAVTFLFGLIHGFGFATVLRELGLGQGGLGLLGPLAGFNLGVEAGQLAVAAVILPVFGALRTRAAFEKRWMPVLSAMVALVGLFWLIERLVG